MQASMTLAESLNFFFREISRSPIRTCEEEAMGNMRYNILVFLITLLAASHLGAQNDRGYRTGEKVMSSRKDYCRYLEKSLNQMQQQPQFDESVLSEDLLETENAYQSFAKIRSAQQLLKPYLQRPVTLTMLPSSWQHLLTEKALLLKHKRRQLSQQLDSLRKIKSQYDFNDGYELAYQTHRSDYQWPLQIKAIEDSLRKVEVKLQRIEAKTFTPDALVDLGLEMNTDTQQTPLGVKVVKSSNWFSDDVSIYPAWRVNGSWVQASSQPWLTVKEDFLPAHVQYEMAKETQPALIQNYLKTARAFLPEGEHAHTKLNWHKDGSFVMLGNHGSSLLPTTKPLNLTLPSNLSVMALFDLACLDNN
jgi:hypothetical protein